MIERAFIEQGVRKIELDQYLAAQLDRAGFTKSEIVKTPLVTRIVVNVVSPGLAIGKGGENIRTLTDEIKTRFGIDNPQLEIKEIEKPNLDSKAVVGRIVGAVRRGFSWRSVCFRTVRDIMNAGAKGVEIIVKGVIAGKGQRKRKQRLAQGYMKKVGDQTRLVDSAKGTAVTKIGAIGFKVRIVRPDVWFPDKVDLNDYIGKNKVKAAPAEKTADDAAATDATPVAAAAENEPVAEISEPTAVKTAAPKKEAKEKHSKEAPAKAPKQPQKPASDTTTIETAQDA